MNETVQLLYLIAYAPVEPQGWYKPDMPPRPPSPTDEYDDEGASNISNWLKEYKKQSKIQWPAAWAREILKTLPQRPTAVNDGNNFERGWRAAAKWANRDDLLADIDSPAYMKELKGEK